jgi:hypothetical protein
MVQNGDETEGRRNYSPKGRGSNQRARDGPPIPRCKREMARRVGVARSEARKKSHRAMPVTRIMKGGWRRFGRSRRRSVDGRRDPQQNRIAEDAEQI